MMKRPLPALAATCLLLFCGLPVLATTFRQLDLAETIEAAEVAIRGTVRSSDVQLQDGEPWTTVTFDVLEVLLDAETPLVQDGQLSLDFLGGSVAGEQLAVSLMPQFNPGDEVLLLAYAEPFVSPLVGFNQGLWRLDDQGRWLAEDGTVLALDEDGVLAEDGTESDADAVASALRLALEDE